MGDGQSGLLELLDSLSNRYLGTKGSSKGSWRNEKRCYTGGIFTGCKTSANHEIWERYLKVLSMYYKDSIAPWFQFRTWSFPGSKLSWLYFEKDGKFFYDSDCTIYRNNLAKMQSSLTGEYRSWVDCLRNEGYCISNDAQNPSRMDGLEKPAIAYQLVFNASQSRPDAVVYSSNRTLSFTKISWEFPKAFFKQKGSKELQMYDAEGSFRTAIESWRKNLSNGIVWGEVIDSNSSYSMLTVLEGLLKYCKKTGVQVVTKQEAADICFNRKLIQGNLLYNQELRNTAKDFLPEADVPLNPDGYDGDCFVRADSDDERVLVTKGETRYIHFGIPFGRLKFSMECKGIGALSFKLVKNNSPFNLVDLSELAQIEVSSEARFTLYRHEFVIPNDDSTINDQICEKYGEKIIGLVFDYSGGLEVRKMKLELI